MKIPEVIRNMIRPIYSALFLTGIASFCIAGDVAYVMPKDLVDDAKARGCEQITDFFNTPGIYNSPYVSDVDDLSPEPGFAYWCRRPHSSGGSEFEYILVVRARGAFAAFAGCPDEVKSRNYPNGLSVKKEKGLNLSSFVFVNDPMRRGPKMPATKPMIISAYETSETFYCHDGKWLIYVRH